MIRIAAIAGLAIGAVGAGAAGRALADDAMRIDVAIGETVERDVGFAIGLRCDDLSILHVDLIPSTPASNAFRVTGVHEGTTMCRVGTAPFRPSFVFEIHVVAPPPRR